MNKNIVILKGRSLFTDGIVSKLTDSPLNGRFKVIDLCQPDFMQQIRDSLPDILVIDENDPEYLDGLKGRLSRVFPSIKVIFLDSKTSHIRVVQWSEHDLPQFSDLLNEINNIGELYSSMPQNSRKVTGQLPVASQVGG